METVGPISTSYINTATIATGYTHVASYTKIQLTPNAWLLVSVKTSGFKPMEYKMLVVRYLLVYTSTLWMTTKLCS